MLKKYVSLLMAFIFLTSALPLSFGVPVAKAKSLDEELTDYAVAAFQEISSTFGKTNPDEVAFRSLMKRLYSDKSQTGEANMQDHPIWNTIIEWITNLTDYRGFVGINPEQQYAEILLYIELLQDMLKAGNDSFEGAVKLAENETKVEGKWKATIGAVWNSVSAYSSTSQLIRQSLLRRILTSPDMLINVQDVGSLFGHGKPGVGDYLKGTGYFQYTVSSIDLLEQISKAAEDENLRLACDAMLYVYKNWRSKVLKDNDVFSGRYADDRVYQEEMDEYVRAELNHYLKKEYGK